MLLYGWFQKMSRNMGRFEEVFCFHKELGYSVAVRLVIEFILLKSTGSRKGSCNIYIDLI